MGRYDVLDKKYFGNEQRFSELITVGVFHNRRRIRGDELVALPRKYPSLANTAGEYERDALCLCENHQLKYGLEIEEYNDYGMAGRIFIYDACEYARESGERTKEHLRKDELKTFEERKSGMLQEDRNYPVIDIVLYLGMGHYKGCRSLREGFREIPADLLPYVGSRIQDYGFVLLEADSINPELFKSELRQFFEAMQARNDKEKLEALFIREDFQGLSEETQQVITIHLGQKKLIQKVVEEKQEMCKAMRDLMRESRERGIEKGIEQGIERGIEQTLQMNLANLMKNLSLSLDQAMDALGVVNEQRERCRKFFSAV